MLQEKHRERIKRLPAPIAKACRRFANAKVDDQEGVLRILHQPWVGIESFALWVFSPATKKDLKAYQKIHQIKIPSAVQDFLALASGFQAFDFDLFGVSPRMSKDPPLLDRSGFACIDLATENRTDKLGYDVDPGWFMFGARCYSDEENCGYFLSESGTIYSYLAGGVKVQQWRSFERFLESEIAAAEAFARREYPKEWKQVDKSLSR